MTENEEIKEKVEILFKLGRSYINKAELPARQDNFNSEANSDKKEKSDEDVSETDVDLEDLAQWRTNKSLGFKRVSPTVNSQPQAQSQIKSRLPAGVESGATHNTTTISFMTFTTNKQSS